MFESFRRFYESIRTKKPVLLGETISKKRPAMSQEIRRPAHREPEVVRAHPAVARSGLMLLQNASRKEKAQGQAGLLRTTRNLSATCPCRTCTSSRCASQNLLATFLNQRLQPYYSRFRCRHLGLRNFVFQ